MMNVANLTAPQQVDAVKQKLMALNPGFQEL